MPIEAELADGRILEFPDGTDPSVIQATVRRLLNVQPTSGPLAAGFKSYLPSLQETYGGVKTLLGVGAERVLGEGAVSRGLIESGVASMKEAEAAQQPLITPERGSFTAALEKGIGSVLTEWLPYQAGAGAANVLEALAVMGAGALAGTATAPGPGTAVGAGTGLLARELTKRGIKEATEKILEERGEEAAKAYFEKQAKEAAEEVAKTYAKRGATTALAGQAAFYGTGQTTSRAVEEAEKLGGTATDIELARVLPAAAVSTVAEFLSDKIAVGALKGLKPGEPGKSTAMDLAKNILLNIGVSGTKEVPVEVIQSAAERYGAKLSLTDAQALKEYIDSAAASYGMAVVPGGVGGVRQTMAARVAQPEVPPPEAAPVAPPEAPPVEPPVAPPPVTATPPVAPPVAEQPPTPEETTQERLVRLQRQVDESAREIAELNRRQGMPSPDRPRAPIEERPSMAEQVPQPAPREELLAKQAEVDRARLEAGLPTGEASETPGIQPTPEAVVEPKPVPKIVDNRPLEERAAKNRLMVMQNMLKNQGGDPASLTIIPHPTAKGRFAIQSLDVPTKYQPEVQGRKQVGPAIRTEPGKGLYVQSLIEQGELTAEEAQTLRRRGEVRLEGLPPSERAAELNAEDLAINGYINELKKINTPAAREFVRNYETGRFTREDVLMAVKAQRRMAEPIMLNFPKMGEKKYPIFVGPDGAQIKLAKPLVRNLIEKGVSETEQEITKDIQRIEQDVTEEPPTVQYKPRGESSLREQIISEGFVPPEKVVPPTPPTEIEPESTEPPTEQPANLPKSLKEFRDRLPSVFDKADIRAANEKGDLKQLAAALQASPNLITRRVGELAKSVVGKVKLSKPGKLNKPNWAGQFTWGPSGETIKMRPDHAGNEEVNTHEVVHALTVSAQLNPITDKQKRFAEKITKLYEHVKKELNKKGVTAYGLQDELEFTAEAMSNPEFQYELMQIPYPGKKSAWSQFVQSVANLLGITNTNALTEVMTLVEGIAQTKAPRKKTTGVQTIGTESKPSGERKGKPGERVLETIRSMDMDVPKPDPTKMERAKESWEKAKENPKMVVDSAKKAVTRFLDTIETWAFSGDAKLNNDVRRAIISDFKSNENVLGQLLEMSQSQAVHADALASQFLIEGGLRYNDDLKKWESVESKANFPALTKRLEEIAKKYDLTKEQMERVAHAYLVSKRLPGLLQRNEDIDNEIAAEEAKDKPDRKKINDLRDKKVFISDKQMEQMEPGLSLVQDIPELNDIVNMWNEIRKNTIDVMVNSGLWSPDYAQMMWDNMDYVPYFREDQIENEKGPQDFIKGLQVKSKEFQLKGSEDAVNDVFDNMIRWTQYAINRSVRAHKALQMIDVAKDIEIGDRKMAVKVTEAKRGMNIARVYRDGKQELYDMADPMYVDAFAGIQNVAIPTLKYMSKVANVFRNSVVLYPLFSVAQVPQDAYAAMFTSGLKTQYALRIPYLAVKEFVQTLMKTSATHNQLKKYGVVGVRDFSATVIRDDAEIYAGLKPPRGGWGKTKEVLSHISMAADNAVRQAVYEASVQQGINKSEALEKAFEIINFRRKGTSKVLNIAGQTIPFFYAYLSAQRVAYKVLTGVGISPTERKEALQTLMTTSAAVMTLSLLYSIMVADDEDYEDTPAAVRDRTLTIPGTGGVRIPLRSDFFLFPKIIAEHLYLLMADKGYEDTAKFKTSMRDALVNAVASPTPFPSALKPAFEVAINYDFFQSKPLVGNFEKQKDVERQFRDSTSEFSKLLGKTGLISPIAADHMIRGMFGSFGGLFLLGTNQFLHADPDVPRPELSAGEMLSALPGTSGMLKRPQESALKNDFFLLRDEVEKAVNTYNDIKNRSPQGVEEFLENEKNMARLMMAKPVGKINDELSKIRRVITQITNMPEDQMTSAEKADNIRQLREAEKEILKGADVKGMREMAKL